MLTYYFDLALRSLMRNKVLTTLMVLAIGIGIGASMTMITVLHVMSGDPLLIGECVGTNGRNCIRRSRLRRTR